MFFPQFLVSPPTLISSFRFKNGGIIDGACCAWADLEQSHGDLEEMEMSKDQRFQRFQMAKKDSKTL